MIASFADRLAQAVRDKHSPLVVGLDPVIGRLPTAVSSHHPDPRKAAANAIVAFHHGVISAVAPFACAVKPQIAFFEEWGPPGLEAFERTVEMAHEAGLLVIADVKRGDIGSTASAYARAFLGSAHGAPANDAVTLNPYLGSDSIAPFLDAADSARAGLFVLVRTSNPSARELQDLDAGGTPVHEHVAHLVREWGASRVGSCGYSSVGAVVGATAPRELARLRGLLPESWLLVPGVGAQGATAADVAPAFDERGLGAVVNASRSVLYAYADRGDAHWADHVGAAARALRDDLRAATGSASGT